jgi:hypothetical protein
MSASNSDSGPKIWHEKRHIWAWSGVGISKCSHHRNPANLAASGGRKVRWAFRRPRLAGRTSAATLSGRCWRARGTVSIAQRLKHCGVRRSLSKSKHPTLKKPTNNPGRRGDGIMQRPVPTRAPTRIQTSNWRRGSLVDVRELCQRQ